MIKLTNLGVLTLIQMNQSIIGLFYSKQGRSSLLYLNYADNTLTLYGFLKRTWLTLLGLLTCNVPSQWGGYDSR